MIFTIFAGVLHRNFSQNNTLLERSLFIFAIFAEFSLHLRSFVPADNGVGFREYDWNPDMDNSIATSLESISKKYGEPDIANHLNLEGNKHVAELVIDNIENLKLL